jgi:hypothetical protein
MAFLSSFYPQPVVAGTTEGTFAEGDDSRIVGAIQSGGAAGGGLAGTYPNPTLASITPTGAIVARTIQNRFADEINVLDYGADPTGQQDSWLAIQRAIYDAGLDPANRIASTISATETVSYGNRTVLKLYRIPQGKYKVYIPAGQYKISKSLVVGLGTHIHGLIGGEATEIYMDSVNHGQFTAITDLGWHISSMENENEPWVVNGTTPMSFNWNHGCVIEALQFYVNYAANQSGLIEKDYYWVRWPYNSLTYATVSGSSGSTELTSSFGFNYWREGKIKLYPSGQVLDIQYAQDNKIYLKEPLENNVTSETYAFGIAKQNGIWMSGGEGSRISNCWAGNMLGSGFHIQDGSPAPIIENCMANFCDVAFLIEEFPCVIIKPSGDCNNTILQCKGFTNTTLIEGKFEDPRPLTGSYDPSRYIPYPNLSFAKALIEIEGIPSGTPSFLNISGFVQNAGFGSSLDKTCIDIYEYGTSPIVKIDGLRTLGWGKYFARKLTLGGTVNQIFARDSSFINDDERTFYHGSSQYFASQRENFNGGQTALTFATRWTGATQNAFQSGITLDIQNPQTKGFSGRMPNRANFSRSGTTVTITYRNAANDADENHGLRVGDMVYFKNYTFSSGTGNLAWNNNASDGNFPPVFTVKTVPTGPTFTINVADSGATAGSFDIYSSQYTEFHTMLRDEHRFQLPNNIGNGDADYRAFSVIDRKKDIVASLAVPAVDKGTWWVKEQFAAGGTVGSPAFRILHGTGVPSVSAPDGSIFLRTDGDASTTLYVRAGGSWSALT